MSIIRFIMKWVVLIVLTPIAFVGFILFGFFYSLREYIVDHINYYEQKSKRT